MSPLERRLAELSAEIRGYPTPIARCDVQLTALLEERSALVEKIRNAEGISIGAAIPTCSPENIWINDGGFNAA